ncbi:uncharacterized protein LOC131843437 [Achroia grisella]|uniref:uncharacterized protein LOC131843437 n=1 Tax=Achroia grisella TaxID=688607 RepID=UPI0027D2104E|nr:uncharacterized protein LOC131843437 [Achroia grisella]
MAIMLYLLLLMTLLSAGYAEQRTASLPPEKRGPLLEVISKCFSETGISAETLMKLKESKLSDDKNFNKFLYCIFMNTGYSDKDGVVKADKIVTLFPESDKKAINKVVDECNNSKGTDTAEVLFGFYKCFINKSPVRVIL